MFDGDTRRVETATRDNAIILRCCSMKMVLSLRLLTRKEIGDNSFRKRNLNVRCMRKNSDEINSHSQDSSADLWYL